MKIKITEAQYNRLKENLISESINEDNVEEVRRFAKGVTCPNCGTPNPTITYDGLWCNYCDNEFNYPKNSSLEEGNGLWANIHAKRKRGEAPAKPGDEDYPETLNIEATSDDYAVDSEAQVDAEAEGMYMLMDEVKDKVANILMDAFDFSDPDSLKYITDSLIKIVEAELDGMWHEVKIKQPSELKEDEDGDLIDESTVVIDEGGQCTKVTKKASSTRKDKKWMKCARQPDGSIKRKHWGDPNARVTGKSGNTKRKKGFRARHGCSTAKKGSSKALACNDW